MSETLVDVQGLRKVYTGRRGWHSADLVAVDGISLRIGAGESVALVGESGSGKTTVAKVIVGLEQATSGCVIVCGRDMNTGRRLRTGERLDLGRKVQMVFQDPFLSLDRRQVVGQGVLEILDLHFRLTERERKKRLAAVMDAVGFDQRKANSRPAQLSGGERQRVCIARALAPEPRLMVLDEAVAALDVSIQAQILNVLGNVRRTTGVSYLVVSHDLAVVRHVADRIVVLRHGRMVEEGMTETVFREPASPYTQLLLDSVPRPGWKPRRSPREALGA